MATATMTGRISQVIGSTFDAEFDDDEVADAHNKGVVIRWPGTVQIQEPAGHLFSDILKVCSPMPEGGAAERKIHVVYAVVISLPEFEPACVIGPVGREQAEELLD